MEKRKGKFNGKKYACIHNLQGDVMGLRDAAGTEVVCHIYDAWNKLLSTTGSMAASLGYLNPFRYRGYVNDEETGLHYLKSNFITTNRWSMQLLSRMTFLLRSIVKMENFLCI